jgi:hypothetical protein
MLAIIAATYLSGAAIWSPLKTPGVAVKIRILRTHTGSRTIVAAAVVFVFALFYSAARLDAWGEAGHRIIGLAAAKAVPADMPDFFRQASAQLSYLNPEPDRWRDGAERAKDPALDGATAPDHFIDLEMIPADRLAGALAAPNRYAYLDTLRALGLDGPKVGLLPFRILELTQTLRVDWKLWRAATDDGIKRAIEARIINDAGILGHYVADGSNPMHTSVQFNGWAGANPNGYATDKQMHGRFESAYIQAQLNVNDVSPLIPAAVRTFPDIRSAAIAYLRESNALVEPLYQLDKVAKFDAQTTAAENKKFAAARLAAGAIMLRDLWYTAYATSRNP